MIPNKIYLDNTILIRYFLRKFYPQKYKNEPQIIRFLNEHTEIQKFISIISIAELVKKLIHGNDFKKFDICFDYAMKLIEEFQSMLNFKIIETMENNNVVIDGIVVTKNIIKYISIHSDLPDCIHLDIARQHDIWFVTYEKELGRLKEEYGNIITEDKLMKQFT